MYSEKDFRKRPLFVKILLIWVPRLIITALTAVYPKRCTGQALRKAFLCGID